MAEVAILHHEVNTLNMATKRLKVGKTVVASISRPDAKNKC